MIDLSATFYAGGAQTRLQQLAADIAPGVHDLIEAVLQQGLEELRGVTHRSADSPDRPADYIHTQDAYAVEWDSALHGTLVNTAPQFWTQTDVPAQTIRGNPVLHFYDGGSAVFATEVHFPGPNEALVAALEQLPDQARAELLGQGVDVIVKGRP